MIAGYVRARLADVRIEGERLGRPVRDPGARRAPASPAEAAGVDARRFSGPPLPVTYRFFSPTEAAFVEAATDRLIPADDEWPGALWAGVPAYIDGQLADAYGQGARFYASGPWEPGLPSQGHHERRRRPRRAPRTRLWGNGSRRTATRKGRWLTRSATG